MQCHIITIGDELLRGDTLNTNAAWLGSFLTDRGVDVARVSTIADETGAIKSTVQHALQEAGLVITTGGLGPTHDDITKQAVANMFKVGMKRHEPTLALIKERFKKRNIPFTESNYGQAEVPENCAVMINKLGTAPGLWFEREEGLLGVLPGIPREMRALVNHEIWPRIKDLIPCDKKIFSHYLKVAGIGESTLSDEIIGPLDHYLSDDISVAYLPSPIENTIRINVRAASLEKAYTKQEKLISYLHSKAGNFIIGEGKDFTLSESLGGVLRDHSMRVSVAESCTGGMLGHTITNVPGSSDYFTGGVIAYANDIKIEQLQVAKADIIQHGAVSKPVALQMAKGVARLMETDAGLSTTGIAGPGGGRAEKPVGTIWIGYWSENNHFALRTTFGNNRKLNKSRSVAVAMEMARRAILHVNPMPYNLKPHFA